MKATVKFFKDDDRGDRHLILRKKKKFYKTQNISNKEARRLTPIIENGSTCACKTINSTMERYLLMGNRRADKLVIHFGMVWKKKDKEFRKGVRAIRKSSKCEGIFRELTNVGLARSGSKNETTSLTSNSSSKGEGRKGKKKKKGGKGGKKKKKGGKKGKKNRKKKGKKGDKNKKNKKNKKDKKDKKKKKDKKGRKKKGNKKGKKNKSFSRRQESTQVTDSDLVSKWAAEDQALNNFMKVDN